MLPHVLPRHGSHESLELAGVRGHDRIDVGVEHSGARDFDGLERELEAAVGLARDTGENDRRVEAQRKDGGPAWRLCQAPEKRHPRRRETGRRLIDEEGHGAAFADRAERFANQPLRLLGTSGTVTTLASVFLELPRYDRRAVDGITVPAAAMRDISRRLAEASLDARAEIACIGRERADLVVAGCAILESIIDLWPAARVGVADRGIREGILRTLAMQGRDIPVTRREHRK